ncbi:hypothetical protein MKW92_007654 [Papaver armeniacum]|nr:hypothetical protein MKW92_007654 [Papaver armeniacum]
MDTVAEVRRVSTTKVQPASYMINNLSDHNHKRIDLNPWDLVYLRQIYMQRGFLFTKSQSFSSKEDDMISHLKTCLSYALDHFFPLAGRLGIEKHEDDNTMSVYINCNSEGAEFVHATADISIDDIVSQPYTPPGIIDPLFSLNGVMNYEGQSHPLLAIQITELSDGVFIGCSTNHSVCDGTSFWRFINLWSEICRSSNYHTPSPPPVFDRWFIRDTDCPIRLPVADEFLAVRNISDTKFQLFKGHVEKCFRFTKANIAKLKARANPEIISETNQRREISSLQAVLAHIWTAVLRARSGLRNYDDENEETSFGLVMDNRSKLIPPLPEAYFGNSGSNLLVTAKDGEVLQRGFGFLASLLNEVVKSINDETITSTFESRTKTPVIFINSGDEAGSVMKKNLWARGSHRFNMYGNDFGWGRPIAVKTGMRRKSHGMTTLNEGPVEGSIDVEINLTIEVFKAMENDAEFMEALAV